MEKQIILLYDLGANVPVIVRIMQLPERTVHMVLDTYAQRLADIEEDYYKHEAPKVREQVQGLIDSIPLAQRREMRRAFLEERIRTLKPQYLADPTPEKAAQLKRLMFEIKQFTGAIEALTEAEIALAKQYPLASLIENKHGMALCPFHKESRPSFNIKNNFYYCHGCGEHGDVIRFVMKRDSLTFPEAVKKLLSL